MPSEARLAGISSDWKNDSRACGRTPPKSAPGTLVFGTIALPGTAARACDGAYAGIWGIGCNLDEWADMAQRVGQTGRGLV